MIFRSIARTHTLINSVAAAAPLHLNWTNRFRSLQNKKKLKSIICQKYIMRCCSNYFLLRWRVINMYAAHCFEFCSSLMKERRKKIKFTARLSKRCIHFLFQ